MVALTVLTAWDCIRLAFTWPCRTIFLTVKKCHQYIPFTSNRARLGFWIFVRIAQSLCSHFCIIKNYFWLRHRVWKADFNIQSRAIPVITNTKIELRIMWYVLLWAKNRLNWICFSGYCWGSYEPFLVVEMIRYK